MTKRSPAVKLEDVGKRYGRGGRERWALREVNLSFSSGEIVGFIGPNGAGKTTLIKLISGLSRATEGEISVLGNDLRKETLTPDGIGLVVESPTFIPYLSGLKNLKLLADIRRVADEETIVSTLRKVGLDTADRRPTRAYSLGMRQRLGLAQALMEEPRLLLLDEPTNGLDPQGIIELRSLIRRLAGEGVAIFMASHLLTEVEQLCNRVLLVREGRVVKELDQRRQVEPALKITVSGEKDRELLLGWVRRVEDGAETEVRDGAAEEDKEAGDQFSTQPVMWLTTGLSTPRVVRELVEAGVRIEEVCKERRTLEQEFMELVGTGAAGA